MKNRFIFGKTIKSRLLCYNFIIICIIAVIFSVSSYLASNRKITQIAKNSLIYHVQSISYRYQMAYDSMKNTVLGCTERSNFDLHQLGDLSTADSKKKGLDYAKTIANFCAVTGYDNYIIKLAVFNENGILIQAGNAAASIDDDVRLLSAPWFGKEMDKEMDSYFLDLADPLFYKESIAMLPIVRRISSSKENSYVALCLSTKFFEDVLMENDNGLEMIVVTHTGARIVSLWEEETNKAENDRIIQEFLEYEDNKGFLEIMVHGKKSMAAYEKYEKSGIMVVEFLPLDNLKNDRLLILYTVLIIFFGCVLLGLFLSFLFTNQVRKPIAGLVDHLSGIASGNFTQDPSIESEDEIGTIGKVVNNMSGQIEQLMAQRLNAEKEHSALELKMLQAQINPHFLYNTLDSIKWMAVIQKNSGIVKAVMALSGLLKNMAKGFDEKVTLKQELDFLNDYVIIEKMKYVELFDVVIEVDTPELYKAKVMKLTLQPLVENSIFYGIEPGGKNGLIKIHAYAKEEKLFLTVFDNGIGIPEKKIAKILEGDNKRKGDRMSGIGLNNVDRRIKLAYGEEYGIEIESREGEFTKIIVVTPLEMESPPHIRSAEYEEGRDDECIGL